MRTGAETVLIWVPEPPGGAGPQSVELVPGGTATFGRGEQGHPVDVRLPDAAVSRIAGRIRAVEDFWMISNLSAGTTYVVENPEGGGEFVKVAPGRLDMPVPFEFARVVVPSTGGPASFQVFAPRHQFGDPHVPGLGGAGEPTVQAFPLDRTAKYFLVLVAMCEPALRDSTSVAIPTAAEIVQRLGGHPSCGDLTVSAVHFHIDYLASHKLRVKERAREGQQSRTEWQRSALVSLALRFDLVREDHLALLPPVGATSRTRTR
ncbi:MAG: FHA domain-containing protein [Actinomycetales bacterium]|nr:FHA domain-containing protein [Actinomycetales bacterium]